MRYILAVLFAFFIPLETFACGTETDCTLGDHSYRIQMPDVSDKSPGALIFAHGYKSSSRGTMRNASLRQLANELGVALVAPDAIMDDWSLPNAPAQGTSKNVDEIAYFDRLREALITDHDVDPDRIVMSGFSAGGMMVWNLACARPGDYAGFIPIAGTFWSPVPDTCATPTANLIHIHGTSDKIVPLTGRPIAETRQGDVGRALAMYRNLGGYAAEETDGLPSLNCEAWRNADSALLMQCLHSGGHSFKSEYVKAAWHRLMPKG